MNSSLDRKSKKMTLKKFFFGTGQQLPDSPPPPASPSSTVSALISPRHRTTDDVALADSDDDFAEEPPQRPSTGRAVTVARPVSERPSIPPRSATLSPSRPSPPTAPAIQPLPPHSSSSAPSIPLPHHKQSSGHRSQPLQPLRRPNSPLPDRPDRPTGALPPTPPPKSPQPSPLSGSASPASPTPPRNLGQTSTGLGSSVRIVHPKASPKVAHEAPAAPEPESPEELAKMMEKRTHIAKELLATEQSYVRSLTVITTAYMNPLMQWNDIDKSEVTKADLKQIFSNVEMLLSIHNEILTTLEQRLASWSDSQVLGDCFVRIAPFLKMYNEYANNYNQAQDLLAQKLAVKEGKANLFAYKLYDLEQASGESNPLPSLIIMPIQRIPRYNLLLADLLKNTPKSHADRAHITTALAKMEETASYINNSIRESENNKKFLKLAAGTKGAKGLIAPHRALLMESTFFDKQKKKNCYIWLFNDIVIHMSETKAKNLKNMENPNFRWPLSLVWANESAAYTDTGATAGMWFELVGPMKAYTLRANSVEDKKKFLTEWRNAVNKLGLSADEMERTGAYTLTYGQMAGGRYDGTWFYGKFHGMGTFTHHGNTYEGEWDNNKRHGQGVMKYVTGEVYDGHWRNNKQHGYGTVTYPNGDIYRGDWEDGLKSGTGEFIFASGEVYNGEWRDGFACGHGTLTTANLTYTGGWQEDKFHGRGVLQHTNGRKYEGEFVAGQKQGQGVLTYGNGDIYRGAFHHDTRHGQGVFASEEGGYEGCWDNDAPHGHGKMIYSSRDVYDGNWSKGQRHGLGVMTYTSGSYLKYDGEWANHMPNGKGVLDLRNGVRYEGMFKAGRFHGFGLMVYPNGVRIEGKWVMGVYDGKLQLQMGKGGRKDQEIIFTGTYKEGALVHEKIMFDLPPRQPIFHVLDKD